MHFSSGWGIVIVLIWLLTTWSIIMAHNNPVITAFQCLFPKDVHFSDHIKEIEIMDGRFNPLLHRLFLDHDIFRQIEKIQEKIKLSFEYFWKYYGKCSICSKRSKCSIFNNIFKYMIFQKAYLWSKGRWFIKRERWLILEFKFYYSTFMMWCWQLAELKFIKPW